MARRNPIIPFSVFRAQALALNGPTSFGQLLPVGPLYRDMMLRINIALTVGSASGPITNGILNFIRQIYFKSDNNEVFIDNLPARALVEIANCLSGTMPRFDQIAASTATYRVDIPVYFAEKWALMERNIDTGIDTSRYDSMVLDIVTGPLSDLFTSAGTASVAMTCDLIVNRSKYQWNSDSEVGQSIIGYPSYSGRTPVDANATTEINLNRSGDDNIKRVFIHTSTSGTAGLKWQGANSDAIIDNMTLGDTDETHAKDLTWAHLQDANKAQYETETVRSGVAVVDLVQDCSNLSALNANRNTLKLSFVNQGGVGANSFVTLVTQSWRTLKDSKKAA
jgi:hypothetical protein